MATSDVELAQAGDVCQSCLPIWEAQKLPCKNLVAVTHSDGTPAHTTDLEIPVVVCPYCDGDIILTLGKDDE